MSANSPCSPKAAGGSSARAGYVSCDFFFRAGYISELVEALRAPEIFALQMRNHAYLMTGPSIPHTYLRAHMFENACEVQLKVMPVVV